MRWLVCGLLLAAAAAQGASLRRELLDDMRDASVWKTLASDQVQAALRRDADGSLCLDVDFAGVSGYAVMRRELPLQWPEQFEIKARMKGRGSINDLQLKLVDVSGYNVWWVNRPDHVAPVALADVRFKRRHVQFAWGPASDRTLRRTQFIELAVVAGKEGGKTSLCLDRLTLMERSPDPAVWPAPRVTTTAGAMTADFGHRREFNGVALRWPAGAAALDYALQASLDGRRWRALRRVRGSNGGFDALFLPEAEARYLRVNLPRGVAAPELELRSAAQWPTRNAVLASAAADARRGDLPRAFVGEQNYWTLVGVDGGGDRSALISEDGAIEVGRAGFSIEPIVLLGDGRRATWADVQITHSLRDGYLPLPSVHWRHASIALDIEAAADGPRTSPDLLARYVLRNTGNTEQTFTLMLALRPWQVNPPQQFLSTPGGLSPVRSLRWAGSTLTVNDGARLLPTPSPDQVLALPLDGGLGLPALQSAPALTALKDPQGLASAALMFRVTLAPGAAHRVAWLAPLGAQPARANAGADIDARFDAVATHWRERLNRVRLSVPAEMRPVVDTLRTSLAHILMSRDGPALRPGTRSYARAWTRDGAMMVAGLLRLGEVEASREFVDWIAGHIFASGKVPCCVDQRGADPVAENDSHGQYLYSVAELWRHTGDRSVLERHWPTVRKVLSYMEGLRQSERTDANRTPTTSHLFGLMPPSISHEGYADKPAYSYWDDFWALRGFKDAVLIARALGHEAEARQWAGWRDEFGRELVASISATADRHGLQVIAGAADRGDHDPTSTTMALNPAQAQKSLPPALLSGTFERYWQEAQARSTGQREWLEYTPYELRNVGALVRLGQTPRALALLEFFFSHQRPRGWNQWAEVVRSDARKPHFLGDMPHAWVSSDFIRSALDLFAFEREDDDVLVIGAAFRPDAVAQTIDVRGLSTPFGSLDYRLAPTATGWSLELPRALAAPPGGAHLLWPGHGKLPRALHDGNALSWTGRELQLPALPATVQLVKD